MKLRWLMCIIVLIMVSCGGIGTTDIAPVDADLPWPATTQVESTVILQTLSPEVTPTNTPLPTANQAAIALANALALQAEESLENGNLDLAGLLILEALEGSYQQDRGATVGIGPIAYAILDRIQPLAIPLVGHPDLLNSAAFSPDGTMIVTTGGYDSAWVWTVEWEALAVLDGHEGPIRSATFSPDGSKIVTASFDGTARVWTVTGEALTVLEGHTDWVNSAVLAPMGRR